MSGTYLDCKTIGMYFHFKLTGVYLDLKVVEVFSETQMWRATRCCWVMAKLNQVTFWRSGDKQVGCLSGLKPSAQLREREIWSQNSWLHLSGGLSLRTPQAATGGIMEPHLKPPLPLLMPSSLGFTQIYFWIFVSFCQKSSSSLQA